MLYSPGQRGGTGGEMLKASEALWAEQSVEWKAYV